MFSPDLWRRSVIVIISVEGFVGGQERDVGLHGSLGHINQGGRLLGLLGEAIKTLLHRGDFVRMVASQVVLFVRIFGEVVELDVGRKYRSPNQLPIALTQRRAKRLDIIDNLSAGRSEE